VGVAAAGGLTGAGARITGAFGDVFAKLSFDDEFIEQRQQTKTKPPKMGWKLGSFAKVRGGAGVRMQVIFTVGDVCLFVYVSVLVCTYACLCIHVMFVCMNSVLYFCVRSTRYIILCVFVC